jgi:hypothetical protein
VLFTSFILTYSKTIQISSTLLKPQNIAQKLSHFFKVSCPNLSPIHDVYLSELSITPDNDFKHTFSSATVQPISPIHIESPQLPFFSNQLSHSFSDKSLPLTLSTNQITNLYINTEFSSVIPPTTTQTTQTTSTISISATISGSHFSTHQPTTCLFEEGTIRIDFNTNEYVIPLYSLTPHPARSDDITAHTLSMKIPLSKPLFQYIPNIINPNSDGYKLGLELDLFGPISMKSLVILDLNNHRIQISTTDKIINLPSRVVKDLLYARDISINFPDTTVHLNYLNENINPNNEYPLAVIIKFHLGTPLIQSLSTQNQNQNNDQNNEIIHHFSNFSNFSPFFPQLLYEFTPILLLSTSLTPSPSPLSLPEVISSNSYYEPHTGFLFLANSIAFTQNQHNYSKKNQFDKILDPNINLNWDYYNQNNQKVQFELINTTTQFQFNTKTRVREGLFTNFQKNESKFSKNIQTIPLLSTKTVYVGDDNIFLDDGIYFYHYGTVNGDYKDIMNVQNDQNDQNDQNFETLQTASNIALNTLQSSIQLNYQDKSTYQTSHITVFDPLPVESVQISISNSFKDNIFSDFLTNDFEISFSTFKPSTKFPNTIDLCIPLLNIQFKDIPTQCVLNLVGDNIPMGTFPGQVVKNRAEIALPTIKSYPYCLDPTWDVSYDYSQDLYYRMGDNIKQVRFVLEQNVVDIINTKNIVLQKMTLSCENLGLELYKQRVFYHALYPLFFIPVNDDKRDEFIVESVDYDDQNNNQTPTLQSTPPTATDTVIPSPTDFYEEQNLLALLKIQFVSLTHDKTTGRQTISQLTQHTIQLTLQEPPIETNELRLILLVGLFFLVVIIASYSIRTFYKKKKDQKIKERNGDIVDGIDLTTLDPRRRATLRPSVKQDSYEEFNDHEDDVGNDTEQGENGKNKNKPDDFSIL